MAVLARVRVALTGGSGLPGVCTFYAVDPILLTGDLNAFWAAMAGMFPANVTASIENSGDLINDADGKITGSWANGIGTAHPSANGPVAYPAPVGACVTWATNGVVNGHRVKGRTFIVPLWGNAYEQDGSLSAGTLANIRPAATVLANAHVANFRVWARPFVGKAATATRPAIPARVGNNFAVNGATVTDQAAVLRSRRN